MSFCCCCIVVIVIVVVVGGGGGGNCCGDSGGGDGGDGCCGLLFRFWLLFCFVYSHFFVSLSAVCTLYSTVYLVTFLLCL